MVVDQDLLNGMDAYIDFIDGRLKLSKLVWKA